MIPSSLPSLFIVANAGLLVFTSCQESSSGGSGGSSDQQIQCYACGMPKVTPENDMAGSYGVKTYNHTCDELTRMLKRPVAPSTKELHRFVRTCPAGVQSCFGATGVYEKKDVHASFMGCSESKHNHPYGCDTEKQDVKVRSKDEKKINIKIDVKLCFCSTHLCNHPEGELFTSGSTHPTANILATSLSLLPSLLIIQLVDFIRFT